MKYPVVEDSRACVCVSVRFVVRVHCSRKEVGMDL